jgi:gliding motility-associated lipoprotein GldH
MAFSLKCKALAGNLFYFILLFLLFSFVTACDKNQVFEENKEIEKGVWDQKTKIVFNVNINDTLSWNNIYINIRNSGSYPFSNLFLFVSTQSPKGQTEIDTLECKLADDAGKWLGDGIGDLYDNQILFKRNVRFPMKGMYKIQMEQAMRVNPLPFIVDIGVRIEKTPIVSSPGANFKKK